MKYKARQCQMEALSASYVVSYLLALILSRLFTPAAGVKPVAWWQDAGDRVGYSGNSARSTRDALPSSARTCSMPAVG